MTKNYIFTQFNNINSSFTLRFYIFKIYLKIVVGLFETCTVFEIA